MSCLDTEAARLEKFVAFAWTQVLGLDSVEREESFLLIGGDSLSALAVSKRFVEFSGDEWPEDGMITGALSAKEILKIPVLSLFAMHLAEHGSGKDWKESLLTTPEHDPLLEEERTSGVNDSSQGLESQHEHNAVEYRQLRAAAAAGQLEELRKLINLGVNVNGGVGKDAPVLVGVPALHAAAHNRQPEAVELLLDAGALPNSKMFFYKRTAAHCASYSGCLKTLEVLLKGGAAVRAKDKCRLTLVHDAARGGDPQCVELLLKSNCTTEIDARDKWGRTPLHWTVLNGNAKAAQVLIAAGAVVEPPKMPNRVQRRRTSLVQPTSLKMLAKEILPPDHEIHEVLQSSTSAIDQESNDQEQARIAGRE